MQVFSLLSTGMDVFDLLLLENAFDAHSGNRAHCAGSLQELLVGRLRWQERNRMRFPVITVSGMAPSDACGYIDAPFDENASNQACRHRPERRKLQNSRYGIDRKLML
jgi:hypothetical protein